MYMKYTYAGRAVVHAVSRLPLTAMSRFQSQARPCGPCWGQGSSGTCFWLSFLKQLHAVVQYITVNTKLAKYKTKKIYYKKVQFLHNYDTRCRHYCHHHPFPCSCDGHNGWNIQHAFVKKKIDIFYNKSIVVFVSLSINCIIQPTLHTHSIIHHCVT